jgi:hypothetical protein
MLARVLQETEGPAGTAQRLTFKIFAIVESVVPLRWVSPCAGAGTGTRFPAMTDVSPLAQAPARRERPVATVTATELGAHLALSRQRIGTLADVEHVIQRLPDGRFDQDDSRLRYLRWLRDPARRSARSEADAEHVKVKTELLRLRAMEKRRELVRREDVNELLDAIAGLVLTKLGCLPARVGGADLVARRKAESVVLEVRREIAAACSAMADERGEPPLEQQG